ncbi:MAG TPA: GtrA family protein [Legionellaceae bacterium]|nr:GtrA family protein [Legionellaceae bacterium]
MNKKVLTLKNFWNYLTTSQHLRIVRYFMVGFTNMTVCLLFMYLGSVAGLHYLEYTVLGYFISILYSFYMNLRFTFRVSGNITKRLILFFVINFTNLGIVEGIEYVMIDIYQYNHLFSIICAMLWYSIAGFAMNSLLVYRNKIG